MTTRRTLANAIRALSMDAIQHAHSGHPGAPMGMADIAEVLWNDYLRYNPANPAWDNRDRFVLSNGHASMLLYAVLHLTGYDVTIDDLKNFRQLHSKTPGHPEYGDTPGVETTTGPLGQGIANAVGMAVAEQVLAATFNRPGHTIVDHMTYAFMGDGCLMEGISHEVCALAGTLGLGKLITFWDDNGISIDGPVAGWFADDTPQRFTAYRWQVITDVDGHDPEKIAQAIRTARANTEQPTLICCKTTIGYGSPNKAGTHGCHGAPLGEDENNLTKDKLDWTAVPFEVPAEVAAGWNTCKRGAARDAEWQQRFAWYKQAYPELAAAYSRRMADQRPADWTTQVADWINTCAEIGADKSSRQASLDCLEAYAPMLPELFGGSADLGCSNLTEWSGHKPLRQGQLAGNYINYGVREFGMSAIMNGISLHGGLIPFGATFLTFSDYARNALRMAALMKIRSIFVFTHDSIGLGEDGPTHQSIEHVPTLRMIPNLAVWRPCDTVESAVAWAAAIERTDGPSCLVFSRQKLPHQPRTATQIAAIRRGGYIVRECTGTPDCILIATGSEVGLAVAAATASNQQVRVVSMPCTSVFDTQTPAYQAEVLPPTVTARIAIEAAATAGWWQYVGLQGTVIGLDTYGASAPAAALFEHFGFTVERVLQQIEQVTACENQA